MRKLGDILLDRGLIKKEQLDLALNIQKTSNKYLGQILIEINAITEDILTDIQASILGLKVVSTKSLKIHPKIIQFIPESIAIKYRLVPIYIEPNAGQNILCMVTSEEPPTSVINKMSEKLNVPIKLFLATFSELEDLLIKHYNKPKNIPESNLNVKAQEKKPDSAQDKEIRLESKDILTPNIEENDDEVLTGSLIEDDGNDILSGDLIEEPKFEDLQENDTSVPSKLDLGLELTKDVDMKENIIPKKVPEEISLDLFDEVPSPSIKLETENNIPTLNINSGHNVDTNMEVKHEDVKNVDVKENKKLNFLEAFKAEDNYVFDNKLEEYISVEIGDDLDVEVEELDVNDVDLFDDVILKEEEEPNEKPSIPIPSNNTTKIKKDTKNTKDSIEDDFPFALDDLSTPTVSKSTTSPKTQKESSIKIKTPPPLNSNESKNKPKMELPKNNDPQNVDKSAFPAPEIKRFKDESENETNPGTTQKISLNDKKVTDDWLKKNKDRDIPDLDAIFGEDESVDPLNNKKIDKIILSKKLENLHTILIDFLKSKKLKKEIINSFNEFFNELENNPSNVILISMLEMIILGEKVNLDLLFDIIFKNIKNVNSENK